MTLTPERLQPFRALPKLQSGRSQRDILMQMTRLILALVLSVGLSGGLARADGAKPKDRWFGDWVLHCTKTSAGENACALHQKIISVETRHPVAAFAIARNTQSDELRLAVILPLGLDIPAGVSGKAGDTPIAFAVQTCVRRGCIASTQVDDKLLETLHGTQAFTTTFKMRSVASPTTLSVSLKGLEEGLKVLEAK